MKNNSEDVILGSPDPSINKEPLELEESVTKSKELKVVPSSDK